MRLWLASKPASNTSPEAPTTRSASKRIKPLEKAWRVSCRASANILSDDPSLLDRIGLLVSCRQAHLQQLEDDTASKQQKDLLLRMRELFKAWLQ